MDVSKDDQSVPVRVEGLTQPDRRVKNPITTDELYLPYFNDHRGPYDDSEANVAGRKKNENLYDYLANDMGYVIQGQQGQNIQHNMVSTNRQEVLTTTQQLLGINNRYAILVSS